MHGTYRRKIGRRFFFQQRRSGIEYINNVVYSETITLQHKQKILNVKIITLTLAGHIAKPLSFANTMSFFFHGLASANWFLIFRVAFVIIKSSFFQSMLKNKQFYEFFEIMPCGCVNPNTLWLCQQLKLKFGSH